MENIQNDQQKLYKTRKNSRFTSLLTLSAMALMVSSCSLIEGIFKAGMGFGIFAVLAVFVVIAFIIMQFRKKS